MVNITDIQDELLSKRSLACCVANLKEVLCKNLRSGDIVSMCSPCQFVLLLPNAKEADVRAVMERVKKVYFKKYVHSPAKLTSFIAPFFKTATAATGRSIITRFKGTSKENSCRDASR